MTASRQIAGLGRGVWSFARSSTIVSHTNWKRFNLIPASSNKDSSRHAFSTKLTLVNHTEVLKIFLAIVVTNFVNQSPRAQANWKEGQSWTNIYLVFLLLKCSEGDQWDNSQLPWLLTRLNGTTQHDSSVIVYRWVNSSVNVATIAIMTSVIRVIIVVIVSVVLTLDVRWVTLTHAEHQEEEHHAEY